MHLRNLVPVGTLLSLALAPLAAASTTSSAPDPTRTTTYDARGWTLEQPVDAVLSDLAGLVPRAVGGRAALRAVGDRLGAVARLNGRTPQELRRLLLEDDMLVLTPSGRIAYEDRLVDPHGDQAGQPAGREHATGEDETGTDPPPTSDEAVYPTSQTFELHSRPGADRTIFLDFDGTTSIGSRWHTDATAVAPFSLDDDPAFSAREHTVAQQVWLRVAEDFAPFDVDVTTEDPGRAALARHGTDDRVFGTRVQITSDVPVQADLCSSRYCTGVAFVGVFDEPGDHEELQPAWVFTAYYNDASTIAGTVSHEVGHTLGLDHDDKAGDDVTGYYPGHANWTPIMGSGPGPVSQWSDGAFEGSRNTQDDLALMVDGDPDTREGGLSLVPDEAGGTIASAASFVPISGGLITHRRDVDVYALGTCSGEVTVRAAPARVSPNLDIELQVRDASGTVLGRDDPPSTTGDGVTADGMGATVRVEAEGELYARVDGVGTGEPTTAYDDYGSLGRYTLSVSGCDGAPVMRTTVPDRPTVHKARPGRRGGQRTARIVWRAPATDGGAPVTGYVVLARKMRGSEPLARSKGSKVLRPGPTRTVLRLPRGRWAFQVVAVNEQGRSKPSKRSRAIRPR